MGTAVQDWHRRVWRPFFEKQPLPKGRCLDTASAALSPARARLGRRRARRRAPLEGVRAPKRRSTSSLLRRRSWLLLFLDRVWPPRSSALCFLVQKEVEREKKKPKNFFFRDDKVFDPVGFSQITFLFSQFIFLFTDLFSFTDFLLLHCFPRQIVVG